MGNNKQLQEHNKHETITHLKELKVALKSSMYEDH